MADYYPLIARAVATLSEQSPEARRTVYDRARAALTAQLRSVDPPLAEADVARELRTLDAAIERLEAEYRRSDEPPAPALAPLPPRAPRPMSGLDAAPPRPAPERPEAGEAILEDEDDVFEEPPARERPRIGTRAPAMAPEGRMRSVLLGAALVLVVGAIAVVAWLLRDTPSELPEQAAAQTEAARPPETDTKFADRVAGERTPAQAPPAAPSTAAAPRSEVPVAQRAILYQEDPANPQAPKASAGRAIWRLDAINAGQGQPLETVVRATVEIPDANLSMTLLLRRNADATLPASHTIELTFSTPAGDANRTVRDVGLLQLKADEALRGTPIAGLPVPVRDNLFLIGLSNLKGDIERNTDLLLTRNWIDLPIRFASGQRAIISFEKGVSGEQALRRAFEQWR